MEVDAEIVSEELLAQLPEELAVLADDDLLPTVMRPTMLPVSRTTSCASASTS